MESRGKSFRTLGAILFSAGILVGMLLFIFMNWAFFEASYYFGPIASADKSLTSLRCPLMLTAAESGEVSIRLANTSAMDLSISVQIEKSYFGAATLDKADYPLAAGATETINWAVTPDNLVFGHLVIARVYQYHSYTLPSRSSTCGTVVVPVSGLSGLQVFIILLVSSLVGTASGWGLWLAGSRPLQMKGVIARRAMLLFTVVVLLGMLGGILGWWMLGLVCAVAGVLLTIAVAGSYLQKE
jgi:hypothetical protein